MMRYLSKAALGVLAAGLMSAACLAQDAKTPAFPGAEGFGAFATGGRGGKVIPVTSLDDYGRGDEPISGSLRAAVEAHGPRIVVFRTSGTISLKEALVVRNPHITIAGQTAPGGGICLKDRSAAVVTHDVVIRHLRFRPGDEPAEEFRSRGKRFEPDALSIGQGACDVIIDHCSASWPIDEVLSVSGEGITDVTVQWCIISESLNQSTHGKGKHGYGSLLRTNGNVTFHHNLYAQHASRCPRPGTYGEGSILLDFRNNVIHNGKGYSAADPVRMNYVANHIHTTQGLGFYIGGDATKMFIDGNFQVGAGRRNNDQRQLIGRAEDRHIAKQPFPTAPVRTDTAQVAFDRVLTSAGAILPERDAVDRRVVAAVRQGIARLIDSQREVGGWPTLEQTPPPPDTDSDGMPDAWEAKHGLRATEADDRADPDEDGYTNIEEYLNGTDPRRADVTQ